MNILCNIYLSVVHDECSQRENNQRWFTLRGVLDLHDEDLYSAIHGAVQLRVDDHAADSIYQVLRIATNPHPREV
jgi:hypothetical protein